MPNAPEELKSFVRRENPQIYDVTERPLPGLRIFFLRGRMGPLAEMLRLDFGALSSMCVRRTDTQLHPRTLRLLDNYCCARAYHGRPKPGVDNSPGAERAMHNGARSVSGQYRAPPARLGCCCSDNPTQFFSTRSTMTGLQLRTKR